MSTHVLVLNAGSSSLKFALFAADREAPAEVAGRVERIGTDAATLVVRGDPQERKLGACDQRQAFARVIEHCRECVDERALRGVGHRIVHGGPRLTAPVAITNDVIAELRAMAPYDPAHQGPALVLIEAARARWPTLPQVACFDTSFHASMPRVAQLLPLPRRFGGRGLRRYGFHGLSYTHAMEELRRADEVNAARGRVVLAHLGNGASLAGVRAGQPIDTTMGFSPNSGLPMSTRSAELDPGVVRWLAREERLEVDQIFELATRQSGLLGVSETSGDLRDLLTRESEDGRAADAVALFCHHVRKAIGGLAAALGGIDVLVFTGGVGEHVAPIRERICAGLEFLGIDLDPAANTSHSAVISRRSSRVAVRVIAANEERIIAREMRRLLPP